MRGVNVLLCLCDLLGGVLCVVVRCESIMNVDRLDEVKANVDNTVRRALEHM